jgi:predicted transcriptional regulator
MVTDIIAEVVRTIIQLSEEQAAALDRAARRRGVSKAAVVREALAELLAPEQTGDDAALRRALAAAGSFASGVPDLAERHDDYLTST